VKNINNGGENLMRGSENDELAEKGYNPWLTNLAFALHPDTILYANLMNQNNHLDHRQQYEFYKYGVRPKVRKAKWVKHEKDEDLDVICDVYQCNRNVAREYLSLLTQEQLNALKKTKKTGGKQ
jgi:hypothetical protein